MNDTISSGVEAASDEAPLRTVLTHRGYWQWLITSQLVLFPPLMTSLGFVIAGTYATGSTGVGGLMVTAYVMAFTLFAPVTGRLLDRMGPTTGAPYLLGAAAIALTGLAIAVTLKSPAIPLFLLAGLAGALAAGSSAAMRSILSQVVPSRLLPPAIGVNSTVVEVSVVTAPLIVALAVIPGPPGAVVAMVAFTAIGALGIHRIRNLIADESQISVVKDARNIVASSLWRNRRFAFWLLASVAFGHALGTAETGAFPLATNLGGGTHEAVFLVAVLAITSALSGLAYAAVSHRLPIGPFAQAPIMLTLLIAGCLGLGLSDSWIMAAGAMVLLGLCTAPLNTLRSVAAEDDMPSKRKAEGFGILFAANGFGFALGGLFLAVLPLEWMLATGGGSALLAIALMPALVRRNARS